MVKRELYLVLVTRASGCEAWLSDSRDETTDRAVTLMERTIARAEEFTGCYIVGCSFAEIRTDGPEEATRVSFSHDGDIMLQSTFDPIAGAVVVQTVENKSRIERIANEWLKVFLKN